MRRIQLCVQKGWVGAIAVVSFILIGMVSPTGAQSPEPGSNRRSPLQFVPPTLENRSLEQLADRGAPRRRGGAGTRGGCPALTRETPDATALVPLIQPAETERAAIALGLTTQARPTFWVYIPYTQASISTLRFVLLNESNRPVTQLLPVATSTVPGLVGFRLPETAPELEIGKYYHWYMLVDCQPAGTTDIFVEALIQRVQPSAELSRQLAAEGSDIARVYAEQGIWYDALTQVQTQRQQNPSNTQIETDWTSLLESVGLGAIAQP